MGWHSFKKKLGKAMLGVALGPEAAIAAVDKRAFIDVMTGGLAEPLYYQPKKQAETTAAIQREANRQAEAVAAREAGTAPQATNQGDALSDLRKKKSAMRRAIYTASTSSSQKLGD